MQRRTRREGQRRRRPRSLGQHAGAEVHALLPLAPAGAEAGVALHRLDVLVTARHGGFELVDGDVFAAADEGLHGSTSIAFVLAAGVAGLEHRDAREGRQVGLQALPDPARQDLAGRVLEAGHIVQIVMIKDVVDG